MREGEDKMETQTIQQALVAQMGLAEDEDNVGQIGRASCRERV